MQLLPEKAVYKRRELSKTSLLFPAMKTFSLFLLLLTLSVFLAGCATDSEDRAFFETGWRHPGENDVRLQGR